jgi:hypothetical protein
VAQEAQIKQPSSKKPLVRNHLLLHPRLERCAEKFAAEIMQNSAKLTIQNWAKLTVQWREVCRGNKAQLVKADGSGTKTLRDTSSLSISRVSGILSETTCFAPAFRHKKIHIKFFAVQKNTACNMTLEAFRAVVTLVGHEKMEITATFDVEYQNR